MRRMLMNELGGVSIAATQNSLVSNPWWNEFLELKTREEKREFIRRKWEEHDALQSNALQS